MLVGGGILAAVLNLIFRYLSLKRQFRQALDMKMRDRISDLIEGYYGHIASSSQNLVNTLNLTLWAIKKGKDVADARKMCFYLLVTYFHHLERLRHERPVPLFTEMDAERKYVDQIHEVYRRLPFGFYDVSFLLSCFQTKENVRPVHEFVELIEKEEKLKRCYERFSHWLEICNCGGVIDENCDVHKVIEACLEISLILNDQTKKMYFRGY